MTTRPLAGHKRCPNCEEEKSADLDHFYADKNARDGLGSWCKSCVNGRAKPQSRARLIRSRARHRAAQALIERYPEDFEELYQDARATAVEEDERLTADPVNHARFDAEAIRLRPGRRKPGEDPEARVDDNWCVACSAYHAADHRHSRSA
jgi:hypothetical protein